MKSKRKVITAVIVTSLFLLGCNDSESEGDIPDDEIVIEDETNEEKPIDEEDEDIEVDESDDNSESDEPNSLEADQLSDALFEAIQNEDMDFIAEHVSGENGLIFSPYVHVEDDALVFEKGDVSEMLESDEVFNWGHYDGSGEPIELTAEDYFDEFLTFSQDGDPDEIVINDLQSRGNSMNNIDEVFPNADVVEFYFEGTEENAHMDWASILFIYEKNNDDQLQLIAIVRDMWTI